MRQHQFFHIGCLIGAMLLWASSFIALKVAIETYHPIWVIFGRMLVASLCFLLLLRGWRKFSYCKGDWKPMLLMSACEPCLYFILEGEALRNTSAAQAGMITSLLPLLVAFLAWFTLKEKVNRNMLIGFVVAIVGVCWLSFSAEANEMAPNPLLGNSLEFAAMVCAAVYSVCLKKLSDRYSALFLTAMQAFVGVLFFSLCLPFVDVPSKVEWNIVGAIVYLGAFVTLGAYLLYNYAISRVSVTIASAYVNLIPVFTLILAYLLLGERFTMLQIAASTLVIGGVVISQIPPKRRQDALQPAVESAQ